MSSLNKLQSALEVFRSHDELIPSQRIEAFLLVAMRKRMTMQQVADDLGVGLTSASRNLKALGEQDYKINRQTFPGLGLVKSRRDPIEGRRLIWEVTHKGKRVATQLSQILA